MLSVKKIFKYTNACDIALELTLKGSCTVEIIGYDLDGGKVKGRVLQRHEYSLDVKKTVNITIHNIGFLTVSFKVITDKTVCLYGGQYVTFVEEEYINRPHITLITTTYKKERYVLRNKKILENTLLSDSEISDYFDWIIIDNGNTLLKERIETDNIRVFGNKNTGGAGGFARGVIEAHKREFRPSHILVMDDDVSIYPDSFYRVFNFLSLLKDEYADHFIGGAMLEMNRPYIQYEDIGYMNKNGGLGAVKPRYNLNKLVDIVKNEKEVKYDPHQYQAWWFCCIPAKTAAPDNLPMPLFVRDDDVEFSIRNSARIININGVCICHESFESRFSGAVEWYQGFRNELIVSALHDELKDIDLVREIGFIFWQELFKYNYNGCTLIMDAIEDYLRGPDFLMNTCGSDKLVEKRKKENQFKKMPEKMAEAIDQKEIYTNEPLTSLSKLLYDYTCNGQKRITFINDGKIGVIPYGWGYYPKKQFFKKKVIAVDIVNKKYTVLKKDLKKFEEVSLRYNRIMEELKQKNESVIEEYKKALKMFKEEDFWLNHLDIY